MPLRNAFKLAGLVVLTAFAPIGVHAQDASAVNESPRERSRVLLKRNPIASEYLPAADAIGTGVSAVQDAEDVDFRRFFTLRGRSDTPESASLSLTTSRQDRVSSYAPGGDFNISRWIGSEGKWLAQFRLSQTAATRRIEHYQARWVETAVPSLTSASLGLLGFPRFSADNIKTREQRAKWGLFRDLGRLSVSYEGLAVRYRDDTYRNRLEYQVARGELDAASTTTTASNTIASTLVTDAALRRYFHQIDTERDSHRHQFSAAWQSHSTLIEAEAYWAVWRNDRLWNGWNFTDQVDSIGYAINDRYLPDLLLPSSIDLNEIENSVFSNYRQYNSLTTDRDKAARLHVSLQLQDGPADRWLTAGVLVRQKARRNDHERPVFESVPSSPLTLAEVSNQTGALTILGGEFELPPGLDPKLAQNSLIDNSAAFAFNDERSFFESLQEQYRSKERVTAVYGELSQASPKWRWQLGLRFEHTHTQTVGTFIGPESDVLASGGTPVSMLDIAGTLVADSDGGTAGARLNGGTNYQDWLPSLSVTWKPASNMSFSASAYRQLMRPQYFDTVSYRRISPPVRSISEGNPSLSATVIDSLSAGFSWQGSSGNSVGFGIYHKSISDFFYDSVRNEDIDGITYDVSTVDNGNKGFIRGAQLSARGVLPDIAGVSIALSLAYTYSDASAKINDALGRVREIDLPERSRHLLRAGVQLSRDKTTANLALRYQNRTLDDVGETNSQNEYRAYALDWRLSLQQRVRENWVVSLSAANLSNHPERGYDDSSARVTNTLYSYRLYNAKLTRKF